jgi:hypothetical protein
MSHLDHDLALLGAPAGSTPLATGRDILERAPRAVVGLPAWTLAAAAAAGVMVGGAAMYAPSSSPELVVIRETIYQDTPATRAPERTSMLVIRDTVEVQVPYAVVAAAAVPAPEIEDGWIDDALADLGVEKSAPWVPEAALATVTDPARIGTPKVGRTRVRVAGGAQGGLPSLELGVRRFGESGRLGTPYLGAALEGRVLATPVHTAALPGAAIEGGLVVPAGDAVDVGVGWTVAGSVARAPQRAAGLHIATGPRAELRIDDRYLASLDTRFGRGGPSVGVAVGVEIGGSRSGEDGR